MTARKRGEEEDILKEMDVKTTPPRVLQIWSVVYHFITHTHECQKYNNSVEHKGNSLKYSRLIVSFRSRPTVRETRVPIIIRLLRK